MAPNLNQYRSLLQSLVQQSINIIGDLAEQIVYNSTANVAYDPVFGTATPDVTVFTFNGAISRFTSTDEAGSSVLLRGALDNKIVVTTDAKLTCAYLDLPVTPTTNDTLTAIGKTWKVIRLIGSPGSSAWVIHIRET